MASTASGIEPKAVIMTTAGALGALLISLSNLKPSIPAMRTSEITSSMRSLRSRIRARSPFSASNTRWPLLSSAAATIRRTLRSSSTTSRLANNLLPQRKFDREARPAADLALDENAAAVRFHDFLGDKEAETGGAGARRIFRE